MSLDRHCRWLALLTVRSKLSDEDDAESKTITNISDITFVKHRYVIPSKVMIVKVLRFTNRFLPIMLKKCTVNCVPMRR